MDYKTHIIIIRLSAMGDVAMTVPSVRALSAQYPDAKITMVSRAFFKPFFDDIPNVSFFVFDDKKKHKGFLGILKLFWELKKLQPKQSFHTVLQASLHQLIPVFAYFRGFSNYFLYCMKKIKLIEYLNEIKPKQSHAVLRWVN